MPYIENVHITAQLSKLLQARSIVLIGLKSRLQQQLSGGYPRPWASLTPPGGPCSAASLPET